MQLFSRKDVLVMAFRLPFRGQVAEQVSPQWLVKRLQSGEVEFNRLGGLTMNTHWGVQQCAAGDVVVLYADDSIGFEKPEKFADDFEEIESEKLFSA